MRYNKLMVHRGLLPGMLLFCLGLTRTAAEPLVVERPVVLPDTPANRALVEELAGKAALLAERCYGQWIQVRYAAETDKPASRVGLTAVLQEGSSILTATLHPAGLGKAGGEGPSFAITGALSPESAPFLANVLFLLWSSLHGYLAERLEAAPELVEELPVETILRSALPEMPPMLAPTSAAVSGSGSLLLGFSMICLELDPDLRLLGAPGRSLYEQGNYSYAYAVAATPAGSIFLKPGMGRDLFRLSPGAAEPQRWRLPSEAFGPFTALPDGSAVIVDSQRRQAYRVLERKTQSLPLHTGPFSYVSALAVGPGGTLWVYDAQERRVRIHGPDGRFIDSVLPLIDPARGIAPLAMAVRSDGSFLLYCSPGELWAFTRVGVPLWRLASVPGWDGGQESLPQAAVLASDSRRGLVWLADPAGRRVLKLLDRSYCRRQGIASPQEERVLELNRALLRAPGDPTPLAGKAALYEQAGAYEVARELWQRVLELDPQHPQARQKTSALEVAILAAGARGLRDRTLQALESYGPETARLAYSRTVQLYERILALDPANSPLKEEMRELKERFQAREAAGRQAQPSLAITRAAVSNLFPSLLQHYRRYPTASVEVQNLSAQELHGLKASFLIKGFMDYPSESAELPRLAPGEKAELALPVLLNPSVLELEEDLPVQAGIEVTALAGGQPLSLSRYVPLTIYRRNALSWDDSGKLASFVTPNDGVVTRFAHLPPAPSPPRPEPRLAPRLQRAARICDTLGAYGIEYVEDPDAPISKVLGQERVVDTVRLPRVTLLIKAGDCDDTTALLASLLESAGIATALMTSPGHVFLAFDTRLPASLAWAYSGPELQAIPHAGTLWLPVETTLLAKGFVATWREASRLYREHHEAGRLEFLPLADLRERYPPIPLSESAYQLAEPAPAEVESLFQATRGALESSLYRANVAELGREAAEGEAAKRLRALNRLGILHAKFGFYGEAEKAFQESARVDQVSIAALLNLAALRLARGQPKEGRELLELTLRRRPDSAQAELLLALAYFQERQAQKAAEHYRLVERRDPALAARYAYLAGAGSSESTGRAGLEEQRSMPWSEE